MVPDTTNVYSPQLIYTSSVLHLKNFCPLPIYYDLYFFKSVSLSNTEDYMSLPECTFKELTNVRDWMCGQDVSTLYNHKQWERKERSPLRLTDGFGQQKAVCHLLGSAPSHAARLTTNSSASPTLPTKPRPHLG